MTPKPPAHDLGELQALTAPNYVWDDAEINVVYEALPDLLAVVRATQKQLAVHDATDRPRFVDWDKLRAALRPFYGGGASG